MSDPRQIQHVVVGAGPGGYVAAIRLAQYGRQVAVVERDALGGTCLNYGCIPSKALIHAAGLYDKIRSAPQYGITVGTVRIDLAKLQAWKREVVQRMTSGIAMLFKKYGIEWIKGSASFEDDRTLRVNGGNEGNEGTHHLKAESFLLATGGRPIEIPGFAIDGIRVISSKEALDLTELPQDLVVIGGGVIGLEIGSLYAQFGSRVTVIELTESLLPGTDPDLVRVVERELKKRGVAIHLKTKAAGLKKKGRAFVVEATGPDGPVEAAADKVLLAVGVRPETQGLNLEAAGVKTTPRGFVQVDGRLATSVPHIYAIGDLVGPPLLAHKASKEGLVAAEAMSGRAAGLDIRAMPGAIFTHPEVATVGLSETEARKSGRKIRVGTFPFAASGRALSTGATEGFAKVIADEETDVILGVGIVGEDAANLIGEAALAIEMGATAGDLALTVHPHPTLSEALMEAAEAVHGMAIHVAGRAAKPASR